MDPTALTRYSGDVSWLTVATAMTALGISPLGYTRKGRPIYPIAGGDASGDLTAKIDSLVAAIQGLSARKAGMDPMAAARQSDQERMRALLHDTRTPSIAAQIMGGGYSGSAEPPVAPSAAGSYLKASLGNAWQPGMLLTGLIGARSSDAEEQQAGKAILANLGLQWRDVPPEAFKATLGTTGPTGGYVLPNNLVDTVVKPAIGAIDWTDVLTIRDGVSVRGVDQPFRLGPPARMTTQDWGSTKENVNETYGTYAATLGTFARIMDLSKQYARFSAGAAEADVMDELAKAARLTIEYEVLAGPGTGTVGTGDPCLGIVTSLLATPTWLGYRSAKTGAASNSTVAGAFASAMSELFGLMATRGRFPSVVAIDSLTYWTLLSQGSDTAGFWLDPKSNGGYTFDATGGLLLWGVPIRHSPNFNAFTGTTKAALAIDGKAFKLYRGLEFRIDSTDVAGDRWDKNLVGFRGEMELGFNAETAVHAGAAQWMTAVIP